MSRYAFCTRGVLFIAGLFAFTPFVFCMDQVAEGEIPAATRIAARDDPSNALIMAVTVGDDRLQVTAERYFAGAITSIVYRGKEYIKTEPNRFGVELQSAASFDDLGECYNPTEAGGRYDNQAMAGSSSELLNASVGQRRLETTTRMAFWWPPQVRYSSPRGDNCGARKDIHYPSYREKLSDFILHKRVIVETTKIDIDGKEKLLPWLDYRVTFAVPDNHASGQVEAVTAYLPSEFTFHASFDPALNLSSELMSSKGRGMSMQNLPVILATPDKLYAMGVYAVPMPGQQVSYGSYKFPGDTNKWNCLFHEKNLKPGKYDYRCLIAIGTVREVELLMRQFDRSYVRSAKNTMH